MMLKLLHVNDAATPQKQWIPEKMMMMEIMVAVCESRKKNNANLVQLKNC